MNYSNLSQKERDQIYILKQECIKPNTIAKLLGRHRSTICRGIKRNSTSIESRYNNSMKEMISQLEFVINEENSSTDSSKLEINL